MSDQHLHNQASKLAGVHVELPLHQHRLKAQLMHQAAQQQGSQPWFLGTFITSCKETLSHMQPKMKIAGAAGAFAALALVVTATLSMPAPASAAQQQLNKTKAAVHELSPQEAAQIKARVDQRMDERLDEAKQAKDLRLISGSEFERVTGLNPAVKLHGLNIKSYLAFTAANGERTVIAVGSDDKPVLVLFDSGAGWRVPADVLPQ